MLCEAPRSLDSRRTTTSLPPSSTLRFPQPRCRAARGIARIRARSVDAAIARVAARYPRTVKSNAWDVMEQMFTTESTMFGADLFHASADGHLAFAAVGREVVDRAVEIWQVQSDVQG